MDKSKPGSRKKIEKEVELLKNQLARALADYDNLRKRTEAEKEAWVKFSAERILVKLIPLLDMLEAAQKHIKDKGLEIIFEKFKSILRDERIEEIRPKVGENFNAKFEEVVETVAGSPKGEIVEVVFPGWKFIDGPVVRFAKVKVYGEKTGKEKELEREMARKDYM
jgi:molecular chaperone GrpE